LPDAFAAADRALSTWRGLRSRAAAELDGAGPLPGALLALVDDDGAPGYAGGALRIVAGDGAVLVDRLPPGRFREVVGEAARPWSYTRLAFHRPAGQPAGLYRVGPLARLAAAGRTGTPRADAALAALLADAGGPLRSPFDAHGARLVELLHALERIDALLGDPALGSEEVLAPPGAGVPEAVGACEAPRGTLFHHYRVDADGLVTWANFVVATGQNALAMDLAVRQTAERWLEGERITAPLLARVEAAVRAFDPCFSCATHAAGVRLASVRLLDAGGRLLDAR
jgi:NAD-reducing hydrogenase large subunit